MEKKQKEISRTAEHMQSLRKPEALYLSVRANKYHYPKDQEKVITTRV